MSDESTAFQIALGELADYADQTKLGNKTALIRDNFPKIYDLQKRGISLGKIAEVLSKHGVPMTRSYLKTTLERVRKDLNVASTRPRGQARKAVKAPSVPQAVVTNNQAPVEHATPTLPHAKASAVTSFKLPPSPESFTYTGSPTEADIKKLI